MKTNCEIKWKEKQFSLINNYAHKCDVYVDISS